MFFKEHFKSIADILDAKYRSYDRTATNPADKGELCEIFVKEFINDSLGDSYKIYRGGRIIDSLGNESKQMDIVLCGKRSIKLFGDKGIYPTETVYGAISVTATLSKSKLLDCCEEFKSIPKKQYRFTIDGYISESFREESVKVWRFLAPYKCIFAYKGELKQDWIKDIIEVNKDTEFPFNSAPDIIVVNKIGMIEKVLSDNLEANFNFTHFDKYPNYGVPFIKMLYSLNTFNWEELLLRPDIKDYLDKDLEI